MQTQTKAPMLGSRSPTGPGGRTCACCGEAPGKDRTAKRRSRKRSERQKVNQQIIKEISDD